MTVSLHDTTLIHNSANQGVGAVGGFYWLIIIKALLPFLVVGANLTTYTPCE